MTFLNRNVNFVLLFLIIIVILGFAGTTVYFQYSIQDINNRYNKKLGEANSLLAALKTEQNKSVELNQAFLSCSNQSEEEQRDFNVVVTDLTGEKDELNKSLIDTQSKLSSTLVILSNTQKELSDTKSELSDTKEDLLSVQAEKEDLEDKVDDYADLVKKLSTHVNDLGEGIEDNCNSTTMQNLLEDVENDVDKLEDLE